MNTNPRTAILIPVCAAFALLAACGRNDDKDNDGELTTPGTTMDQSGSTVTPVDPAGETSTTPGTTTTPATPPSDPATPPADTAAPPPGE
jgi:hypothetical protein